KFLVTLIGLNLLALLFLIPPMTPLFPFVFYAVNGHLLSREYFELVAVRRFDTVAATRLRKQHRLPLFMAGVAIAFLLTVPVVNLLAPLIATGVMVHLFHSYAGSRQGLEAGLPAAR
ncbi:MAG: EI24 domain-containing protein, partial [Rhodospirillales bacterium]